MSSDPQNKGKSSKRRKPEQGSGGSAWIILIAAIIFGGGAGWLLSEYEDSFSWTDDGPNLIYYVILGIVLTSLIGIGWRNDVRRIIASTLFFVTLGAVLVVGYTYRDELKAMWHRVAGTETARKPVARTPNSLTLIRHRDGHFYLTAWLDGARTRMLIDTGATTSVLTKRDAKRAGLYPDRLRYSVPVQTGNGRVLLARARIAVLEIGDLKIRNVPVLVSKTDLTFSIIGINALRRLNGYEVKGDRMTLKW